jgi:hypothetical protein
MGFKLVMSEIGRSKSGIVTYSTNLVEKIIDFIENKQRSDNPSSEYFRISTIICMMYAKGISNFQRLSSVLNWV